MVKRKENQLDIVAKLEAHDKRFDEIDRRLDEHDKRFEVIDKRFDAIDRRFDAIDMRFDGIDARFDEVLTGMDRMMGEFEKSREERIIGVAKDREQDRKIEDLDKRVKVLEDSKV